jgi:hypothetical protein
LHEKIVRCAALPSGTEFTIQGASFTHGNAARELGALGIIRLYLQVQKPHLYRKYWVVAEGMWRVARNALK